MSQNKEIKANNVIQEQIFYAGVQCIVFKEDTILLGCRKDTSGEGMWAFPGGHIEFSESPVDAAMRELKEETYLDGKVAKVKPAFVTYTTSIPYVHFPVIFDDVSGKIKIRPGEKFSELKFFSLAEIPSPLFLPSKIAINELICVKGEISTQTKPTIYNIFQASFFRFDLISIKPNENRNRGYCINYMRENSAIRIILSWGRRGEHKWKSQEQSYGSVADAIKAVEDIVKTRVSHGYLLAGAIGEVDLNWLTSMFPPDAEIKIQAGILTRLLVTDDSFRKAYLRDNKMIDQIQLSMFKNNEESVFED